MNVIVTYKAKYVYGTDLSKEWERMLLFNFSAWCHMYDNFLI